MNPLNDEDHKQQDAAANIIRTQLDSIYSSGQTQIQGQTQVQPQAQNLDDINPYERTHSSHPQPQAQQWKEYHSAWQNYYQQYYEGYYAAQAKVQAQNIQPQTSTPFAQVLENNEATVTKEQAVFELRQKLLSQIRTRAKKVRKSRHFIPITAALAVVMVFLFLQYNQVLFATVNAYVSPGAINPQNIVIDPTAATVVSSEPRLIIPKINVDVPVLYDVGNDYNSQMAAMENGVAHFAIPGASSHPGEIGNTVLSGHSSNDLFDPGDYKFIFAQLEKLQANDTIYANYNGTRYTYVVTKTEVVKPTEVSKLVYDTSKPVLTLITCTPLGTSTNRLLVTAEQISPDPASSAPAPANNSSLTEADAAIPGANSPTLIERLFGAR